MDIFLTKKTLLLKTCGVFFLACFFFYLYKLYIPRINAFSCFDDCFNFMGGYFLLHGKKLFSEVFFNHAPFMAYISAGIQYVFHPINLYELILRHRQFVMMFGFIMTAILFLRFGYVVLGFSVLYELTKFYVFGDRFLAEGVIIYVVIYLAGLSIEKLQQKSLSTIDYISAGVAVWFVIFTRETFIPLALFLYAFILWGRAAFKTKLWSLFVFTFLSIVTVFYHNVPEFIFNVFTVNAQTGISVENTQTNIAGLGFWKVPLYPLYLFFGGQWGFFRYVELSLDMLFLLLCVFTTIEKKWKLLLFVFIALALANIRVVTPGREFYETFHMIVWYGLFLFFSFSIFSQLKLLKLFFLGFVFCYFALVGYILFSPGSFTRDRINEHDEYIINFSHYLQVGNVIADLSKPTDTLFLDGTDDIIYWVSHRYSSYQYS